MHSCCSSDIGSRLTRLQHLRKYLYSPYGEDSVHHLMDVLIRCGFFNREAFLVTSNSRDRNLRAFRFSPENRKNHADVRLQTLRILRQFFEHVRLEKHIECLEHRHNYVIGASVLYSLG